MGKEFETLVKNINILIDNYLRTKKLQNEFNNSEKEFLEKLQKDIENLEGY